MGRDVYTMLRLCSVPYEYVHSIVFRRFMPSEKSILSFSFRGMDKQDGLGDLWWSVHRGTRSIGRGVVRGCC
jgi:hypothetical protein